MRSSIKAVVFDLDSTLCEYALTVAEVIERALSHVGLEPLEFGPIDSLADDYNRAWWTAEDNYRTHVDELRRLAWSALLRDRGRDDEELAGKLSSAYSQIRKETGLRLFDGVSQLIDDLKPRYPLGIVTNGPSDMQWPKLRELGLVDRFDGIVVAGDRGFFKPDPRPFVEILELLDAEAKTALFVGDSFEHDIIGAHGAGMRTAWIRSDGKTPPEDADVTPDYIFGSAIEVREIMQ